MGRDSISGKGNDAPAKRQRIDASDHAQFHDFFISKYWTLNTNSPRGKAYANSEIGILAADLGLSWDQTRTKLVNCKEAKYGSNQMKMLVNVDKLEEDLWMSLSMETKKL